MKRDSLRSYLLWAFLLAWMLQAAAIGFAWNGQTQVFRLILAVSMYAPFAAVLLAKIPLRGMGWHLRLKGKARLFLGAWFGWAILGALGAALYFLLFPAAFDRSGTALLAQLGTAQLEQLEAQGLTPQNLLWIQIAAALTYAPFMNAFLALGEEVGWRGAMYPRLKERFGLLKGRLLGGLIWGVWHWPIMILAGYNYGTAYWGAPVLGPLLFCLICTALGTLFDALYEKTDCIWIPALAHGAFNAVSGIPALFLNQAYADRLTLGPLPIGLIGGLPLLLLGAWVLLKDGKAEQGREAP